MKILKNLNKCRICYSKNIYLVLKLNKTPIGENFKKIEKNDRLFDLDLYQCKNCGIPLNKSFYEKVFGERYLSTNKYNENNEINPY